MKIKFQWNNYIPINMMSIILVWLSGDSSLQMTRYWNTQFSLELQCVHVFV